MTTETTRDLGTVTTPPKVDHSEAIKIPGERKAHKGIQKPGTIRDKILEALHRAGGTATIDEVLLTTDLTRAQVGQNLYNMVRTRNATQPGPSTYSITARGEAVRRGEPVSKVDKIPATTRKTPTKKSKAKKQRTIKTRPIVIDNGSLPMGALLQVVGTTQDNKTVVVAIESGRTYKTEAL